MDRHISYYEVREALAQEGCPLCRLAQQSVRRFLDHLLYENVNDPGVRSEVRQARGFCNLHAWQLYAERDALGAAILHRDVLQEVLRQLPDQPAIGAPRSFWQRLQDLFRPAGVGAHVVGLPARLAPHRLCPACRVRRNAEEIYGQTLLANLADAEFRRDLLHSDGLCLPHLRLLLEMTDRAGPATRELLAVERQACERLVEELGEFIRKQDYRFRAEPIGAEGNSWIRAIALVSGRPGVW